MSRPAETAAANPGTANPGTANPGAAAFAELWAAEVSRIAYVPMPWADKVSFLTRQTERLAAALHADPFRATAGYEVGAAMVEAEFAAPEALSRTVMLLHSTLAAQLGLPSAVDRVAQLTYAVSVGHCRAVRDLALDGQDAVRRAAVEARHLAEQQLRAEQARARHAALHDPVTGLPNRSLFIARLTQILSQANRRGRFALCVIGLDNFAAITDALGPRVGDQLLTAVGARLAGFAAQHNCLLARLDGADFGLLVESTDCAEDAIKLTDRSLSLLSEPFNVDDQDLPLRASAGILERVAARTNPIDALRSAHSALHWAQQDGGGRWTLFNDARNAAQLARYRISAAIPGALARGQFALEYQPIVELSTGRLAGVEALARWQHPQLGVIPPTVFIPLATQAGSIVDLGRRLLEQACWDAAAWWRGPLQAPYVSVNVAAQQLHAPGIVGEIATILDRTGLPPHQLQLEITESVAMDANAQIVATLRALADLHIRLAIDDFGTGYANHACLTRLPLHALKLDATFAEALGQSSGQDRGPAIMANLIDLGHALGLSVTAEGITTTQVALLREVKCDLGQGYDLGRPGPAAEIQALITNAGHPTVPSPRQRSLEKPGSRNPSPVSVSKYNIDT